MEKAKIFDNDSQFDDERFLRGPIDRPNGHCDVIIETLE